MNLWNRVARFFEDGDLTPVAVVISVFHYGPVLAAHGEQWFIAWSIGTMIDLLHYRTVRRVFRATGWQMAGYGLIAAVTTAMATMYHLRFYDGDWLFALPIPVGIAILAQHAASNQQDETKALQAAARAAQEETRVWQDKYSGLQESVKELQSRIKEQLAVIKAWQSLNTEAQALARFNAKQITAEQAAAMIGVKDVRTVQSRAEKLNGVVKQSF